MRLLICQNKLPAKCNIGALEPVNVHADPDEKPWSLESDRAFAMKAFGNEVDPLTFKGPFAFDIEPDALWGNPGPEFDKWRKISTNALIVTRKAVKNELLAIDPCGGSDRDQATRNVQACRRMLLSLNGAAVTTYPAADGSFAIQAKTECTLDAYRTLRKESGRLDWQIGNVITYRVGHTFAPRKEFKRMAEWGEKRGLDFTILWQAERYYQPDTDANMVDRIQPYIDILKEAAA